jgi:hypothetical protein
MDFYTVDTTTEKILAVVLYSPPVCIYLLYIFTLRVCDIISLEKKKNAKHKPKQEMGVRHPSYDYTSAESLSPRVIHVVQYQLYSSSAGISRLLFLPRLTVSYYHSPV